MTHILLVDDNEVTRAAVAAYLRLHGYTVTDVPNTRMALERIGPETDVVVADLPVRGAGGTELLRALHDRAESAPVILLSGRFPHAQEVSGAAFVLHKPFEPADLRRTIDRVLGPEVTTGGSLMA